MSAALSADEQAELDALNGASPVGPYRGGFRAGATSLPEPPKPLTDAEQAELDALNKPASSARSLKDRVLGRLKLGLSRAASEPAGPAALLHGAAEALGGQGTAEAIDARAAHDATAGLVDEGLGLAGAAKNLFLPPSAGGGKTLADVPQAYTQARDAERKKEKDLAAEHPIATGLTDVATAFAPAGTARLAVQGFGDSEAKDLKGLAKDTGTGLATAAVLAGTGLAAEKGVGWLGRKVGKQAVAKEGVGIAGKAWGKEADAALKSPELAEPAVRQTPKTRPELFEQGDEYRFAGADELDTAGATARNEALKEAISGKKAANLPAEPSPAPAPAPAPAPKVPKGPKAPPAPGKVLGDIALAAAADYAVNKITKAADIPLPIATMLVFARRSSGSAAGRAIGQLVERAHAAGIDAAGARIVAQQLPAGLATSFLSKYLGADAAQPEAP